MVLRDNIKKISDYLWEIPRDFRDDMRVPARFYTSEEMMGDILEDKSLSQLVNISTLPGIQRYALGMPDIHQGYASPIGGVAGIKTSGGIISPGMTGFDINCGMKLVKSNQVLEEIEPFLEKLLNEIQREIPSGLGKGRKKRFEQIDKILEGGAQFLVEQGYGEKNDVENCESEGKLDFAKSSNVSSHAKKRGMDQVGTLGSGNHFLEIQKVEEVFDKEIARTFGLFENQIVIMIHCGSRGLGHQVCSDYLKEFIPLMKNKYGIGVPDKEFACVPFDSPEGKRYFSAMGGAANYAWGNRQMITHFVRKAWKKVLGESLEVLYDVAHNIVKEENYLIEGKQTNLAVHRKGATRAFPAGHPEVPSKYEKVGQPVLIPGSMGTPSYILVGREKAEETFFSVCHGAGRVMSRNEARRKSQGRDIVGELKSKGILVNCRSRRGVSEESPFAYKDINRVIDVVVDSGLAKKVIKLSPLGVVKGE